MDVEVKEQYRDFLRRFYNPFNLLEEEKKRKDRELKKIPIIEDAIEPIYAGDFGKARSSLRELYRYCRPSYSNGVQETFDSDEKNMGEDQEQDSTMYELFRYDDWVEKALYFVNYYEDSLKPLPAKDSEYDKALKNWFIFGGNIAEHFESSIEKEAETRTLAVCDYIDSISYVCYSGLISAIDKLRQYIKKYGSQTEFLEKLITLYYQTKNVKQAYDNLLILVNRKILDTTSDSKEGIGNLLLKQADCEYKLGYFKKSIETAQTACNFGGWMPGCMNQTVDSYIALSKYDDARNVINIPAFKSNYAKIYSYLIDKINLAERNKCTAKNTSLSDLDINEFFNIYSVSFKLHINKYNLELILKKIESKKNADNPERFYEDYIFAAYMIWHFYGKTEKYYEYLSAGFLYHGINIIKSSGSGKKYDVATAYLLLALNTAIMIKDGEKIEEKARYYFFFVYQNFTDMSMSKESFLAKMSGISDLADCEDYCRLIKNDPILREYFRAQKRDDILSIVDEKLAEAEQKFNYWLDFVKSDVDFKEDFRTVAVQVRNSAAMFKSDKKFIDSYLARMDGLEDFYNYDDSENRISILVKTIDRLNKLKSKEENKCDNKDVLATIFTKKYFSIISATITNLRNLIDRTRKDFATKITLEIPNTNVVPDDSGNVMLSIRIANEKNRTTAKKMNLSIENSAGKEIFQKDLSKKNLIGGDSISELITIPAEGKEAFGIKIKLSYEGGFVEQLVQITIDSGKNFVTIKNPYIAGNIVPANEKGDEVFFGRDDFIKSLELSLKDDRTRCVIIYGQKRSGKSSIFEHLKRKLVDKFIVVDFTLQSDVLNEQSFYKCVQKNLCHVLKKNHYDEKAVKTWKGREISDFWDFEEFIQEVQDDICEPENKEILLMIDEFTRIYDSENQTPSMNNFMDKWKAMVEKNLFKSALIGQENMPEFIRAYPNQFQVTDPIPVSYLEPEYAKELIVNPILKDGKSRYKDRADEKIAYWFNSQPYYIQTYCRKLVYYLNKTKTESITMAIAENLKNQMLSESGIDFFDNLVNVEDMESWSVVKKIVKSDSGSGDVSIDGLNLTDSEEKALKKLIDREVIQREPGNRCAIKIPFFREWIKKYKYN